MSYFDEENESWQRAIDETNAKANRQRINDYRAKLAGYNQISVGAQNRRKAIADDRGIALLACMDSIRKRGGTMDSALCESMSQAFGMNITGAFLVNDGPLRGSVIFGTPTRGADSVVKNGLGMVVTPEMRYKIFESMNAGELTKPCMQADYNTIRATSGLTEDQLINKGFRDPSKPWAVRGAVQVGGSGNYKNSRNGMIGPSNMFGPVPQERMNGLVDGGTDSGARPGPRARFWSKDDFNGRPYRDPEKPGERYLGHGISSFSTATWQEDREEKREPNGRWVETAVRPSDTFNGGVGLKEGEKADNSQVRTYKNTKTGEVVRVKDGETPPWRRNDAVEIAKAKQLNRSSGRSVEDQMAIDNNKAENQKKINSTKEEGLIRRLLLRRYQAEKMAINKRFDEELKESKYKTIRGRKSERTQEEQEVEIKRIEAQRQSALHKLNYEDFEGAFVKNADGGGGAGATSQQQQGGGEANKAGAGGQATGKKEDNVSTASGSGDVPTDEEWKRMSTKEKQAWLKAHKK